MIRLNPIYDPIQLEQKTSNLTQHLQLYQESY